MYLKEFSDDLLICPVAIKVNEDRMSSYHSGILVIGKACVVTPHFPLYCDASDCCILLHLIGTFYKKILKCQKKMKHELHCIAASRMIIHCSRCWFVRYVYN